MLLIYILTFNLIFYIFSLYIAFIFNKKILKLKQLKSEKYRLKYNYVLCISR